MNGTPLRRPRLDPKIKVQVLERLASGETQSAIARSLNMKQPTVSYIQKQAALANGFSHKNQKHTDDQPTLTHSSREVGARSFVAMADDARDDALSGWKKVEGLSTALEWELVIHAAARAASAWAKAVEELKIKAMEVK